MIENKGAFEDCWNHIGVWSGADRSCSTLEKIGHCINCDRFSAAGRLLLDSKAPSGYLEEWSEFCSIEQKERHQQAGSVILFRLGDEWLGLETRMLDEVMPMRPIHSVPHRRSLVLKGLTNVRGGLQLCVSLGRLLNITQGEITGINVVKGVYERMIVISQEAHRFVFPVSEVRGVYRFDLNELKESPATAVNCSVHYLKGMLSWEGRNVGVIDPDLLFRALERGIV